MKSILFLAHRIPYPPDKGDKIRSFNELKYLSKNHKIFLGTTLDEEIDRRHLEKVKTYCEAVHAVLHNRRLQALKKFHKFQPFSVTSFYNQELQDYVDQCLAENEINAIICFCSSMAEYVFKSEFYKKNELKNTKLIMDYVDLDSDKWRQYSKYTKFPMSWVYKYEQLRLSLYEKKINKAFDQSVFVSDREVNVFEKNYAEMKNVAVIPNGVNIEYFLPDRNKLEINNIGEKQNVSGFRKENPKLLFTGVMDYFANEDGVCWFANEIFPKIQQEIPDVEFYIVGNNPSNSVWNLTEIDGVTVTGYVVDIRPFYWSADICVTPLRIARGLQNKVLEAMASGSAVVATSNAADGIEYKNNENIIIADKVGEFADRVVDLIKDKPRRDAIGKAALDNIILNYSWNKNLSDFDRILDL